MMATYCVEAQSGEKLPKERLLEMLDFIFQSILPEQGYTLRHEQLALAQDIFTALERRSVLLSEAGVGIGKTHAYLIAAILVKRGNLNDFWLRGNYPGMAYIAKMPMVVATSSIALQKAIVRDYIPELSGILLDRGIIGKPITCVIRKGKEHYICDKRLHLLWRQTTDEHTKKVLAPLLSGMGSIDLGEMDFLSPYIKRRICVKGGCGRSCGWRETCRYQSFQRRAQSDKLDFQICNHNYLLADTLHRANGQRPLIPNYQGIVIDEAHKFVQAARQMYGVAVSSAILPRLAKAVRTLVFQQGQSTAELWRDTEKLTSQAVLLFQALRDNVPDSPENEDETDRLTTKIDSTVLRRLRNLSELLERLTLRLKTSLPLPKYEGVCRQSVWELEQVKNQLAAFLQPEELVYWLEQPTEGGVLLCAIPKRLGAALHTDLWSKGIPIVLTSGTLAAGTDFTHVKLGLGLDRLSSLKMIESVRPSPFDYKNDTLLYISNAVPFPDGQNPQYVAAVADELERLIRAAHGHTAVLFTSYRVMAEVFRLLSRRGLAYPLFLLERGRLGMLERFRQSGNGVLFASGSMWEGVDLPGDILSLLVIVKLPFAVPDPIGEHERSLFPDGDAYKNAVIVPEMLVKLKQGFGRLIRCESDTGVVALLDSRVRVGGSYRGKALATLPDCPVTSNIGLVNAFLREKKTPTYFL